MFLILDLRQCSNGIYNNSVLLLIDLFIIFEVLLGTVVSHNVVNWIWGSCYNESTYYYSCPVRIKTISRKTFGRYLRQTYDSACL